MVKFYRGACAGAGCEALTSKHKNFSGRREGKGIPNPCYVALREDRPAGDNKLCQKCYEAHLENMPISTTSAEAAPPVDAPDSMRGDVGERELRNLVAEGDSGGEKKKKRKDRQKDATFPAVPTHLPKRTNRSRKKSASTFLFAERDEDEEEKGVEDERKRPRDQGADDDIEDGDAVNALVGELPAQSKGSRLLHVMESTSSRQRNKSAEKSLRMEQRKKKRAKKAVVEKELEQVMVNVKESFADVHDDAGGQSADDETFDAAILGERMADDLRLRTTFLVCAVCSGKREPFELTSVVLEKAQIPAWVKFDERGMLNVAPAQNEEFVQVYACSSCFCNGHVFWKHAKFNVHGLGKHLHEYWWSEELCVATVSMFQSVKHAGQGGHSFKQESQGGVSFEYHNVLASLWGLLEEAGNEEQVGISRVRQGAGVLGAAKGMMMVRVKKLLELFVRLWTQNDLYRRDCLQCAKGEWDAKRVETELMVKIRARLQLEETPFTLKRTEENVAAHYLPWKADASWTMVRRCYLGISNRIDQIGGHEIELLVRAMPTLFCGVDQDKLEELKQETQLEKFSKHLALLSDNRIGKHDRALFVLNWLVVRNRVFRAMFKGGRTVELVVGLENFDGLIKDLKQDIAEELAEKKDENHSLPKKETLVTKMIQSLKFFAKGVLGHPMARAGYRGEMKAYHRMVNPGNVWLTLNVSDKGNLWLRNMYDATNDSDYERVKTGGVSQALFFDAYVKALMDNVLLVGKQGVFGEMEWAGGVIEWCVEGRPHLHLIGCAKKVTPKSMMQALANEIEKAELEKWVGETFCESLVHQMPLMTSLAQNGNLTHVHGALCTKYQTPDAENKFHCRFEYGRPLHKCENSLKAELKVQGEQSWAWKLERNNSMVLCHSDKLHEVHHTCGGGLEQISQYCQLFGNNGKGDGQRVISYCTNYTTKMGLSRLALKKLLLEVVEEGQTKLRRIGESWNTEERVKWILQTALLRIVQESPVSQAQAALNVLGLSEFYIKSNGNEKIKFVPLYSSSYLDYVEGTKKLMNVDAKVQDYVLRGFELENFSPMRLLREEWKKERKAEDGQNDGVSFQPQHPDFHTHWFVQKGKPKRQRGRSRKVMLHLLRRKNAVRDESAREQFAKTLALPWRTQKDVQNFIWKGAVNDNVDGQQMIKFLELEVLMMASTKEEQSKRGDVLESQNEDSDKIVSLEGDANIWQQQVSVVGGESGEKAIVLAKLGGFIPKESANAVNAAVVVDDDFILNAAQWRKKLLKQNARQEKESGSIDTDELEIVTKKVMEVILNLWKVQSQILAKCNVEHLRGLLLCVTYLANVLSGQKVCPFSLVIQGAGGTGKTATIVQGVREFIEIAVAQTDNQTWRHCVLFLAPTNMAAQAIGGVTLDSGIFHRRGKQQIPISKYVRLILIDEYSMVSCQWLDQIEEALRGSSGKLFGGFTVIWIGDLRQLGPVKGAAFHSLQPLLWTGADWKQDERKSFSIIMKRQYRINGSLQEIIERFAEGEQKVEDVKFLQQRSLDGSYGLQYWREKLEHNSLKVLCCENNVKAGLNWEIIKWLRADQNCKEWKCVGGVAKDENLVFDQLEPRQCVWRWMPIISLENYQESEISNGTLCWIVHVIAENESAVPHALLIIAATSKEEAKKKIGKKSVEVLVKERILVQMVQTTRGGGRKGFPMSPAWAMTLHKVQGATLNEGIIYVDGRIDAHNLYMGLSRVTDLEKLWILGELSSSLYLNLKFKSSVKKELKRLQDLEALGWQQLKDTQKTWSCLAQLIERAAFKNVKIDETRQEAEPIEFVSTITKEELKKTELVTDYDWLNETSTAYLLVNCNGQLYEDLKGKTANLNNWWWREQLSHHQKMRLERVWQMEQAWQQSTVPKQKGGKRAQREERIKRKEVENDWSKDFAKGQTWGKLKKIDPSIMFHDQTFINIKK